MQTWRPDAATLSLPPPAPFGPRPDLEGRASATEFQWRVLGLLAGYRLLVVIVLLSLFYLLPAPRAVGDDMPLLFIGVAFAYLAFAIGAALLTARRRTPLPLQLYLQVLTDIAAITIFVHASGGISSGLGTLLVVCVGAASVVVVEKREVGVFPAVAALALLVEYAVSSFHGGPGAANSTSTGLLGATLFVIALAAQPLASRLRESEALARQRGVDLANMAELNHYVIQHLRESLVVIDTDNRIRLINSAAVKSLGAQEDTVGCRLAELSPRLQLAIDSWRDDPTHARGHFEPLVSADGGAMLLPRIAELGRDRPSALLVFLEDQSLIAERSQQSKLAALGRLSASIAHEIRNPVGAMSHAAELLAESPDLRTGDRRLTDIICQNAMRISAIVENVLQLSRPRRDGTAVQRFELQGWVENFLDEYAASNQLADGTVQMEPPGEPLHVRMDPSHLHQILWNLCDNALKYGARNADGTALIVFMGRARGSDRPYLEVHDFGLGIDESISERIFEPFFTSHHGGTGLGLFLARQLAECNGAALACTATPQGGAGAPTGATFRLVFADPDRWMPEGYGNDRT